MTDVAVLPGLWSVGLARSSRHHRIVSGRLARSTRARFSTAAVVLVCMGTLLGCGDHGASLKGMTRTEPLDVGSVVITDVTSRGRYSEHGDVFVMKARPESLLVVYFGYTNCPDLCPTTMALVRSARRELGRDGDRVDLAMVTVDPERDTPDVLNAYLSSFTDRFHALHPESDDELRRAEGAFLASSTIETDATGRIEVGHSATTYVVDSTGTVLVEWPFGVDKDTMINDLGILLDGVRDRSDRDS